MLAIRLTRTGKIHTPHYRIVVQEKRSKLNGKAVDVIGHYHPAQVSKELVIDKEKAEMWMSKGAQPSDTVTNLMVKAGILDASRKIKHFYTAVPKAEAEAPVPIAEEVPEEMTEAPAETAVPEEEPVEEAPTAQEIPAEEPVAETETPGEEA